MIINSAYACDPSLPDTDEMIDSIVITSSKAFDNLHPAGTNLSDLFDIVARYDAYSIYQEKKTLDDFLLPQPLVPYEFTLILKAKPDQTGEFEFTVKYYQQGVDVDFAAFTTDPVVIRRE